jgi:hypothetical protein
MESINQPLGIDECACFAVRKAARQITRFYDAHLEPAGLRFARRGALPSTLSLNGSTSSGRQWERCSAFWSATA